MTRNHRNNVINELSSQNHTKKEVLFVFVEKYSVMNFDLLTSKMTFNNQNNTINVFSSQNPTERGNKNALAGFAKNHILFYLTLKLTFDLEENLESCK